jgi:hypothetical protein
LRGCKSLCKLTSGVAELSGRTSHALQCPEDAGGIAWSALRAVRLAGQRLGRSQSTLHARGQSRHGRVSSGRTRIADCLTRRAGCSAWQAGRTGGLSNHVLGSTDGARGAHGRTGPVRKLADLLNSRAAHPRERQVRIASHANTRCLREGGVTDRALGADRLRGDAGERAQIAQGAVRLPDGGLVVTGGTAGTSGQAGGRRISSDDTGRAARLASQRVCRTGGAR